MTMRFDYPSVLATDKVAFAALFGVTVTLGALDAADVHAV
jgi:hypothetical protein